MKRELVNVMGMEMERWTHESCTADFGVGDDWATLFAIQSLDEGKGHATKLLEQVKPYYERMGKKFGGSVALNDRMRSIYQRLGIEEYTD